MGTSRPVWRVWGGGESSAAVVVVGAAVGLVTISYFGEFMVGLPWYSDIFPDKDTGVPGLRVFWR